MKFYVICTPDANGTKSHVSDHYSSLGCCGELVKQHIKKLVYPRIPAQSRRHWSKNNRNP